MGLRLRLFLLMVAVSVSVSAATAWLTLREADRQVRDSTTASRRDTQTVVGALRGLVLTEGSWSSVPAVADRVSRQTGERVRVVDAEGRVLADSDVLAGRQPRAVPESPVTVSGTPQVRFPTTSSLHEMAFLTLSATDRYRSGQAYGRCLERIGVAVTWQIDPLGVPSVRPANGSRGHGCRERGVVVDATQAARLADVCDLPVGRQQACLQRAFVRDLVDLLPGPVQVYVGSGSEQPPRLQLAPALMVAGGVTLLILFAGVLVARSVLRPVSKLTTAAREVESGRRGVRVAITGRDEVARLATSFNRMADSLEQGEERQRQLIGDVAHELRTPLATLRGYLEAFRDGVLEPTPELIESLHEEVLIQSRLVDDLQELALAEAGALTYHRGPTDLGDVAHSARSALEPQARAAGVELTVEIGASSDTVVAAGDSDRLRQVLVNLVSNAIRACPNGGEVRIRVDGTADEVIVAVVDTGEGLEPSDLAKVFDRFWRADPARGRDSGGSGLGLAVARQIVLDHGGRLSASSARGEGSEFTVLVPRTRSPTTWHDLSRDSHC